MAVIPITSTISAAPMNCMSKGVNYVDVGTSGGVWGLERGYCMMIGGPDHEVQRLDPIFKTLAPGAGSISRTPGRKRRADAWPSSDTSIAGRMGPDISSRWSTTGSSTALWQPMQKGWTYLRAANVGEKTHVIDAETTPLRNPDHYKYNINLPDVAEVWRRGSVIASWLLDLTATALTLKTAALAKFSGRVSDSGGGPVDDQSGDRRRGAGSGAEQQRFTNGSFPAAKPTIRTSCSRRCASSSAAI